MEKGQNGKDYGGVSQGNQPAATSDEGGDGEGGCVAWRRVCRRVFPAGFTPELRTIFSLAWPVYLSQLFNYILGPVSLIFCGHLGREELDGVALAISLMNITGLSVATGLCTACDTLFAQAFGGSSPRLVGIFFQRSLLVIPLSCLVCWSIHLNAEGILLVLGQNPRVARISGEYLLYFMPGLMFNFLYQVLTKYLQNQNYVLGPVVIGGIGNAVNVLVQYVSVYVLEFGTNGSAVAQGLSFFIMCLSTFGYIVCSGMYRDTWSGWSWKALENWGVFLRLAIPGLVMMGIELWSFEIGIFLNGLLGEVELGATSVTFQIESILYMIPLGISLACSIRVGQNLGAGDASAAKTSARVAQTFAWLVFVVMAVLLLSLKNVLPFVFTNDSEVIALVSTALPVIVFIQFLDTTTAVSMGTLRGCGRQLSGAVCNFIGYFVVTVPLAVVLMFVVKIGMMGFWFGLSIGITPICVVYMVMMARIDWDREVIQAQKRTREATRRRTITEESPLISKYPAVGEPNTDPTSLPPADPGPALGAEVTHTTPLFLSTSLEASMTESLDTSFSTRYKGRLLAKGLLTMVAVVAVLLAGVLIRLYVPLPRVAADLATTSSTQNSTAFTGSGATAAWTTS